MSIVTNPWLFPVLVKGIYPAQDGGIAASTTCPHGLDSAECLICKSMGTSPATVLQPDRVYQGRVPVGRRRSAGTHLAMVVVGIGVIGLVAWLLAGAVFAIFHVIELILVAGVAAWGGYRVGRFRGRHERQ